MYCGGSQSDRQIDSCPRRDLVIPSRVCGETTNDCPTITSLRIGTVREECLLMRSVVPLVTIVALSLGVSTTLVSPAVATPAALGSSEEEPLKCLKPKGKIKIEFKAELSLAELAYWAGAVSCETIVVPSQFAKRALSVNIVAPKQMSAKAAWSLFQIALRAMNMAMVRQGGAYVLIEAPAGKRQPLPFVKKPGAGSARMIRTIVSAEHLSANELSGIANALKSKAGAVSELAGTEMILVTDFADHVAKLSELLEEVDRSHAEAEGVYIVPIKHADAAELATTLQAILGSGAGRGASSKAKAKNAKTPTTRTSIDSPRAIAVDPRTRSIILVASKAAYTRARSLISRLDEQTDEQSSHIHMIGLEHADAETLATTLTALMGSRPQARSPTKSTSSRRPPTAITPAITVDGDVRVSHDAPTNSLLILATMRDFLGLSEIVRRLDTTRPQVYIEATIMEVSVSGARDVGGSFHFGGETGGATWLAGLQQDDLQSTNLSSLVGASGLLGGIFGNALSGLDAFGIGQTIPSFGVLFQALATSRDANLLSSPRIMTSDNTPATLKVAESRRELGATTTVATGGTTQAVEQVDAALTLKVTPHVNSTDEVKLEIELVLEEFLPARSSALGSDTSSREITNTVVVRDQESVIIGGLLVEREIKTSSKVPLLGDIPILGHLFRKAGNREGKAQLGCVC